MIVFEKTLEEKKAEMLNYVRQVAYNKLKKTDWVIVKCTELGINPNDKYPDIMVQRQRIRDWCNQKEAEIENAQSKEELAKIDLNIGVINEPT